MTCKNCDKRHIGCHSDCEDYAEQRRVLDEIRRKISDQKIKERALDSLEYERIKYAKKKKGVKR